MKFSTRLEIGLILACFFSRFITKSCANDHYETWHQTLTPFQSHACDDEELHLRCTPSTVISVHYVFYGRQAHSGHLCPDRSTAFISTACQSTKALKNRLYHTCNAISSSLDKGFQISNGRWIRRRYFNGFLNKIVCEGGQLDLLCPEGQGLTIFSASYGTTKEGVVECRQSEGFEPKDCLVERTLEILQNLCSGKQNCSLRADDKTFGSPGCRGTKHLKVAYNCVERVLLRLPGRHPAEETIQTTSFPAWVRGVDPSAQSNLWPDSGSRDDSTPASDSSKLEMQSDEVPAINYKKEALAGDQELVGFMSKWMTAHKYMKGNKDKLVLYLSISLAIGFLVFVTVLAGRFVITKLESNRRNNKFNITPETEDQFFSDSDLEHFEPPDPLPPPPLNYTASMRRKDSEVAPRAPINPGNEHCFS
ncbi:Protein eva-1 like protein [Argiope bruennichi]|uniref:Protein eva-1 like protein n=1 Tax=Argiope bruennichi TaxID=94029 RepID=A0A8T0ELD6_ARGBR|nr:Protein eva-1 like protein [Argiope bruennichi]